ncbi:hypothetical protein A0256_19455 [Mucilaginibacter sp. PAMC 26640]|nr:hypothetical protein A0256_19455 [Mucilaginibacter sp. PAMC 26640]
MKNPFVKQDNTLLIAGIAIGAVAAGAVTYILLSDKGEGIRKKISDGFGNLVAKFLGGAKEEEEQAGYDFRKTTPKSPKTDRGALLKDEVLSHPQG